MRLKKGPSHSFHPPTAIRSSEGSRVYTFVNGAADLDSSSEEELDIMELRARGGELQRQNTSRERVGDVILLERAITENDNLNRLALQYGCKVADIKRVNNLLTEQDMYALKIIKIPVKVHGIFTEHEELNTHKGQSMHTEDIARESSSSPIENKDIKHYFQKIDQNIEAAAQTHDLLSECLDLSAESIQDSSMPRHKDSSVGADWGIRWWNAVFIMLLIGIVLPVFYIIYYETQRSTEKLPANFTNTLLPNVSGEMVTLHRNLQNTQKHLDSGG